MNKDTVHPLDGWTHMCSRTRGALEIYGRDTCNLCGMSRSFEERSAMDEINDVWNPHVDKEDIKAVPSSLDVQVGGKHYKGMKIQPVEFIHANKIPFIEGCIIKRACRWRSKNGIEDLQKIIHEAQLLIELERTEAYNAAKGAGHPVGCGRGELHAGPDKDPRQDPRDNA